MRTKLSYALSGDETLPDGWEWSTVGEIADVTAGNPAPQGGEFFEGGTKPFVRVQDMGRLGGAAKLHETHDHINDNAAKKLRLFPQGSVLFTKSGASTLLNQRAILARDMYVVSHIATAIPKKDISSEWLYYWMRTVDFAYLAHATTLPSLPLPKAKAIPIPVPPPLQQQRIVAEIEKQFSRLDESVANLKRVKANLKRYKASVLKAAVEGKLTEEWRKQHPDVEPASKLLERILSERRCRWEEEQLAKFKDKSQEPPKNWKSKYKEPVAPHSTNFPPLPKGWCWAALDQSLWHLRSGTAETSGRETTDYAVLKSSAVRHGVIDFGDLNYLQKLQSLRPENFLRQGDFLITRLSGSLDYVGCSAVVKNAACEGIQYPDRVFCGKLVTGTDGTYMCYCFQHSRIRKALEEAAKSTAGHQRISMSDLYPLTLPLPPVAEQQRIVAEVERRLSVMEELDDDVEANLTRADRLRQSILGQAFSGKLLFNGARG